VVLLLFYWLLVLVCTKFGNFIRTNGADAEDYNSTLALLSSVATEMTLVSSISGPLTNSGIVAVDII